MSDDDVRSGPECGPYADEIPELALGISTGRQRAQTLAHVEACPRCHAEMEQFSLAADSLLEVVPAIEPPLGFEVRLMERLGAGRAARQPVRRQWFVRRASCCWLPSAQVSAPDGSYEVASNRPLPDPRLAPSPEGASRQRHSSRQAAKSATSRCTRAGPCGCS